MSLLLRSWSAARGIAGVARASTSSEAAPLPPFGVWDSLGCNGCNDTAITGEPSQLPRLIYPIVRQHDQRIGIRADVDHHEHPALVVELLIDPGEQLAGRAQKAPFRILVPEPSPFTLLTCNPA